MHEERETQSLLWRICNLHLGKSGEWGKPANSPPFSPQSSCLPPPSALPPLSFHSVPASKTRNSTEPGSTRERRNVNPSPLRQNTESEAQLGTQGPPAQGEGAGVGLTSPAATHAPHCRAGTAEVATPRPSLQADPRRRTMVVAGPNRRSLQPWGGANLWRVPEHPRAPRWPFPRRQPRMRGRVGGGSGRAPNSNWCWGGRGEDQGERRREERKKGGGESGRGVWKTKGTRQRLGEAARQTVREARAVRRSTGRLRAPTAAARGSRPSPPSRRHHGGQGPLTDFGHHLLPFHRSGDLRGAGGAALALGYRRLQAAEDGAAQAVPLPGPRGAGQDPAGTTGAAGAGPGGCGAAAAGAAGRLGAENTAPWGGGREAAGCRAGRLPGGTPP